MVSGVCSPETAAEKIDEKISGPGRGWVTELEKRNNVPDQTPRSKSERSLSICARQGRAVLLIQHCIYFRYEARRFKVNDNSTLIR